MCLSYTKHIICLKSCQDQVQQPLFQGSEQSLLFSFKMEECGSVGVYAHFLNYSLVLRALLIEEVEDKV